MANSLDSAGSIMINSITLEPKSSCFTGFAAKIKQILWSKTSLKCLEWAIWRCSDGYWSGWASILILVEVLSFQDRRPKSSRFSPFEAKIKQILWWKTSLKCLARAVWHWRGGFWNVWANILMLVEVLSCRNYLPNEANLYAKITFKGGLKMGRKYI